jgi:hypothetical protein
MEREGGKDSIRIILSLTAALGIQLGGGGELVKSSLPLVMPMNGLIWAIMRLSLQTKG